MAYTVYERKVWRKSSAAVSITCGGRIYLNAVMARLFHENGFNWALLLEDAAQRKIAVRPLTRSDKRAYRICYSARLSQAGIHAKSFLLLLGWDRRGYQLDARWD